MEEDGGGPSGPSTSRSSGLGDGEETVAALKERYAAQMAEMRERLAELQADWENQIRIVNDLRRQLETASSISSFSPRSMVAFPPSPRRRPSFFGLSNGDVSDRDRADAATDNGNDDLGTGRATDDGGATAAGGGAMDEAQAQLVESLQQQIVEVSTVVATREAEIQKLQDGLDQLTCESQQLRGQLSEKDQMLIRLQHKIMCLEASKNSGSPVTSDWSITHAFPPAPIGLPAKTYRPPSTPSIDHPLRPICSDHDLMMRENATPNVIPWSPQLVRPFACRTTAKRSSPPSPSAAHHHHTYRSFHRGYSLTLPREPEPLGEQTPPGISRVFAAIERIEEPVSPPMRGYVKRSFSMPVNHPSMIVSLPPLSQEPDTVFVLSNMQHQQQGEEGEGESSKLHATTNGIDGGCGGGLRMREMPTHHHHHHHTEATSTEAESRDSGGSPSFCVKVVDEAIPVVVDAGTSDRLMTPRGDHDIAVLPCPLVALGDQASGGN
ncbi:unnamed protein product [Vitrella brassicaformis CCMP3155]|uniref:Uncharacterized protein n=2 Tax=Vitrella brassicaformis TaxID=1169539 RepID=A0A0G4EGA2_VITBC|nr:unnamed protein product [Vitrella brassicaformis CCMP3155]|eukprot:CEL94402.1 unnamed protein product [Vitrella brassicaformis CCMP3155]